MPMDRIIDWENSLTMNDIDGMAELYQGQGYGIRVPSVDYMVALLGNDGDLVSQGYLKLAFLDGIRRSIRFNDILHDSRIEEHIDFSAADLIAEARRVYNFHVARHLGLALPEVASHRPTLCEYARKVAERVNRFN